MRSTISVKSARENNLKNVDVEIPRDQFVVVTGLSGSGKSSLAFDTIYAEGQRKFLESLSAYSKRFVSQLKKPDVDFVFGLSPVISIEQKTIGRNPRSTVGTMTDIYDYLRILFATIGTAHCPRCRQPVPIKTANQMVEHVMALPQGTTVEVCAPVFPFYGEDLAFLFAEVRSKGCRRVRIDGELMDISEDLEIDETKPHEIEVIVDHFVVRREMDKHLLVSVAAGLRLGEGFLAFRVPNPPINFNMKAWETHFGCAAHGYVMGEILPFYFSFNELNSSCPTCLGLGTYLKVHPGLLVPDPSRSVMGGAFIPAAYKWDKNNWGGRMMWSVAQKYGFRLDVPFQDLSDEAHDILFYGTKGERVPILLPEGAKVGEGHVGRAFPFNGIITDIERRYRHFRKEKVTDNHIDEYLKKVMVEQKCPDCEGKKLKFQRFLVTVAGRTIQELSTLSLSELRAFLAEMPPAPRQDQAGRQVANEIIGRLDLLLGIGMDYLNLDRRASTLSGGESQRVRLSTQIGSGLMGMLYVLDEPSIGLHPRDNVKMIATLKRLRNIGNSVIVVEHDEETIRAADYIVEVGPGPGIHGGKIVAQGTAEELMAQEGSLTGHYLSRRRFIALPERRRKGNNKTLTVKGARENNLKSIDVTFPLGRFLCMTGVSGSGKSTLVNEILFKKLYSLFHDSRVLSGVHDAVEGVENVSDVISIDQTPIGRTPTSNPATYIGVYDHIRRVFAETPESLKRGYTASRFSFNLKGGRCEECGGQGIITTSLHFMPDVEVPCHLCKGQRYNEETLEVTFREKTIADVLDMSIEEAVCFWQDMGIIAHKLSVMNQLGLGYLKLGQSATILSGGEAQRVKLANELAKIKRGGRNFYILDEPTTGLHLADIQRLLDALNRLVDAGNTVLVIEHHLDVIKTADWVIDLGPEGGAAGGEIVAQGTPEEVADVAGSYTGQFLKPLLSCLLHHG